MIELKRHKPTYRSDGSTPGIVLGTASLGGAWGEIDEKESIQTILNALQNGINRIDTAPAYSCAELIVARALEQWSGEKPFVSTKVGKREGRAEDTNLNNYERVSMTASVNQSIRRLGRGSLDLLFLHEPEKVPVNQVSDVIRFLEDLRKAGTVRSVGLGGIVTPIYYPFIQAGLFDVVMGFNDLDACCLSAMQEQVPLFNSMGLIRYQGSALHMGLLGNRYDRYQDSAPNWISTDALRKARIVKSFADDYGLLLSSLAHRYVLSISEVDHIVIGPRNMMQLTSFLHDYGDGVLDQGLFDEINHALSR
ncbi:MAG: aldo/keto reductase [Bacteroidota bacterium]